MPDVAGDAELESRATAVNNSTRPDPGATTDAGSANQADASGGGGGGGGTVETESRRRRRSRWGNGSSDGPQAKRARKRKSRWGSEEQKLDIPPGAAIAMSRMTPAQAEAFLFRLRLDKFNYKLNNPGMFIEKEDLGPEPEPVYDANGQRVNTLPRRYHDKIIKDRQDFLEAAIAKNPALRALAPGFRPAQKELKIIVPVDDYPGYNFIGLIIGPRGNTHRRMEQETECKISIRGKGSSKRGRPGPEDVGPLHVHIIAPDDAKLAKAAKMIRRLLKPVDDEQNVHKMKQLRELALINGTLRDLPKCRMCGEEGHRIQDCPRRQSSWASANVKCAICGLNTHPTQDCPNRGQGGGADALDGEYENFINDIMGNTSNSGASANKKPPPSQPERTGSSAVTAAAPPPMQQQARHQDQARNGQGNPIGRPVHAPRSGPPPQHQWSGGRGRGGAAPPYPQHYGAPQRPPYGYGRGLGPSPGPYRAPPPQHYMGYPQAYGGRGRGPMPPPGAPPPGAPPPPPPPPPP